MHAYRFMIRSDLPYEIRQAFRKAQGDPTPERQLWRAVAARSIADAYEKTGLEDPSEHRTAVREAREFWHRRDEDFELIFSNAGIDPTTIIPFMLALDPADFARKPLGRGRVDNSGNT